MHWRLCINRLVKNQEWSESKDNYLDLLEVMSNKAVHYNSNYSLFEADCNQEAVYGYDGNELIRCWPIPDGVTKFPDKNI
jgi:hypothetical protein